MTFKKDREVRELRNNRGVSSPKAQISSGKKGQVGLIALSRDVACVCAPRASVIWGETAVTDREEATLRPKKGQYIKERRFLVLIKYRTLSN